MKKLKFEYLKGSFFYSLPGILSIFLSLISIPIFLQLLSNTEFADYLMQHFILTFSIILNCNFGKIVCINISKKISEKDNYIYTVLILNIFTTILFSTLFFLALKQIITYFNLVNLNVLKGSSILFGLMISNFYLTLEGIYKGALKYKSLSLFNFLFYSLSMSLPALLLIIDRSEQTPFTISLIIKFLSVLIMTIYIFPRAINQLKISKQLIKDLKKLSGWITINTTVHQIYNYFDKYIIKAFFNNQLFIFYSISQQISSKIAVPLNAYNNIYIAKLSKNYKNKKAQEHLSNSLLTYALFMFFFILLFFPFLEQLLQLWLTSSYSKEYHNLLKIFFMIVMFSSLSNLLIDHYDINSRSKISSFYEICFMPIFLILAYYAIVNKNIYMFALSILSKDILLFLIRALNAKQEIFDKKIIFFSLFLSTLTCILSFYSINYYYYSILFQLIVLIKILPIKKLIKFYKQN
ncbi:putative flippase [Candidatus Pelagibacter sp. IMCC9063]|uniref:lipopolysaccharide biosynthesis protein n=1 Tax=Pelagibacter sp. (strain IMCC9063) TaxID=1002672 RepID=UPI00020463EA|nr:oligosaccharide flippase family protein [Candidatus Pelagibacter sp. IMCC9063]AEA80505.1 putative flippase [Candidatus Pelagibacter sp. IMCC9063]